MGNPFVHAELATPDLAAAKQFYSRLFDWKLDDVPMDYTLINPGEGTGGGMYQSTDQPPSWLVYVGVDDAQGFTEKARRLGAKVLREPAEVPNAGWFSVLQDPQGAVFALWQRKG